MRCALPGEVLGLLLLFLSACTGGAAFGKAGGGSGCLFSKLTSSGAFQRKPGAARRSLLQSSCGLHFQNQVVSFSSCQNVTAQLGTDFEVLWTVVDSGNGNSTLKGAIDAATSSATQWVGFGFPAAGETGMIGGSAIIVKNCSTCSSGASISDYYLGSYDPSGVQPPSKLKVLNAAAALTDGRLQGVFEISLSLTGSALNSVNVLYAAGPLDSSGGLEQHNYNIPSTLDLGAGLASSLGPAIAPSPGDTLTDTSTGSQAPSSSRAAGAAGFRGSLPPGFTIPPGLSLPPGFSVPPGLAGGLPPIGAQSSQASSAPSPSTSSGQGCTLTFAGNNSVLSFSRCQSLATASTANSGIRLFWTISPSTTGNDSVMSGALESGSTGWASFGIPSQPDMMQGANALIVKVCSSCSTGASADNYYLGGYDTSSVKAGTGKLNLTSVQAAKSSTGQLQSIFTMTVPESMNSQMNVIASVGPVDSSGNLQTHPINNAYSGTVDLASGILALGGGSHSLPEKFVIHGILMIVGWGLLIPLGVVFARCKEWGPIWFQLHRACQTVGYAAGVAGAALAVSMGAGPPEKLVTCHRIIGLVAFILMTLQMTAILWRPAPRATKLRYSWNGLHWFLGGSAIFLCFANVFIGLNLTRQPAKWSGLYALAFALILLAWSGKGLYNLFQRPQQRQTRKALLGSDNSLASRDQADNSPKSSQDKIKATQV